MKRGRICTPGALGIDASNGVSSKFPIDLPLEILADDAIAKGLLCKEPRGHLFYFNPNDVVIVEDESWTKDWDRHSDPEAHRWKLAELLQVYGFTGMYKDWENGPTPVKEAASVFKVLFDTATMLVESARNLYSVGRPMTAEQSKDLFNALIDLSLILFEDTNMADEEAKSEAYSYMYAIFETLTCPSVTKSGMDWYTMDREKWLEELPTEKEFWGDPDPEDVGGQGC